MSARIKRSAACRESDEAPALDDRHGSRVDDRQDEHRPGGSPQFQQPETGNLHRLHRPSRAQETFRVRIEDLLLPPNLPAGMDVLTLFSLVALLHKTTEDPAPVSVQREQSHWRITDGRHRAIAALIAGRPDVLAEETA
jgi:hypothetical protein